MGEIWNPSSIPFLPVSHFNARSNTMKLLVLCIFIAGLAATQAKKCDLKKPECVEIFTENETEGPEGPKPKPCDCRKCQADSIALSLTQYCYIPECNEDNTFKHYQYDSVKDESFCFTDCGAEVEGTRQEGPGANCVAPPKTTKTVTFPTLNAGSKAPSLDRSTAGALSAMARSFLELSTSRTPRMPNRTAPLTLLSSPRAT